jgi:hypothetical protein
MQQLEMQYFFPLTEQIPLDLNYAECHKPILWTTLSIGSDGTGFTLTAGGGTVSWSQRIGDWEIPSETKQPSKLQKFMMKNFFGWKWMGK